MEAGQKIRIRKPSFWSRRSGLFNEHGGKLGEFRMRSLFTYRKAEGEVGGRTLTLSYTGWTMRHSEMKDEWGHLVGSMYRGGWCGNKAQIILYEKEYEWKINTWGTRFTVSETNGTEVMRVVGCGGFGTRGEAEFKRSMDTNEAIELLYMGLYQMRLFEMEVAASTAAAAGVVAAAA